MDEKRSGAGDLLSRMLGAARLDPVAFEDVANDETATAQAIGVVILVSVAPGIAAGFGDASAIDVVVLIVSEIVVWMVWTAAVYFAGTTVLRTADTEKGWGRMVRVTGFAQTPALLGILQFWPNTGLLIFWTAFGWRVAAMVIGTRTVQAHGSTWRAFVAVMFGLVIVVTIIQIVSILIIASDPAVE